VSCRCRLRRYLFICFGFRPRLKFWKFRFRLLLGLEPCLPPYSQNCFQIFSVINSLYGPKKFFASVFEWFVVSKHPQCSREFANRSVSDGEAITPHYRKNSGRYALLDRRLP